VLPSAMAIWLTGPTDGNLKLGLRPRLWVLWDLV